MNSSVKVSNHKVKDKLIIVAQAAFAFIFVCAKGDAQLPVKPTFDVGVFVNKAKKIQFAVGGNRQPVIVSLRQSGTTSNLFLWKLNRNQSPVSMLLDVANLPGGDYDLEFNSAKYSIVKHVNITEPTPTVTGKRMLVIE
ncbi:hypothetical protein [Dyadobacter fermentans]|uniref:hypothetical protein n=1 Tax=Dyadobacter fermentans TaxID=94254 RepID=UPI001CBF0B87|nr:hypothetical protein [Dyadobacter fermentans]MBZ1357194.1 hypothetical protein [Dyadobacter fermentans]